jgi:hypothetical protein
MQVRSQYSCLEKKEKSQLWWLTPVIPATGEAESKERAV